MPEPASDLPAMLVALHEQLAAAKNLDPNVRALLKSLLADIDRVLEEQPAAKTDGSEPSAAEPSTNTQKTATAPDSIVERLTEAARDFEGTHPTLAGTVGSVIDALAQMGV